MGLGRFIHGFILLVFSFQRATMGATPRGTSRGGIDMELGARWLGVSYAGWWACLNRGLQGRLGGLGDSVEKGNKVVLD